MHDVSHFLESNSATCGIIKLIRSEYPTLTKIIRRSCIHSFPQILTFLLSFRHCSTGMQKLNEGMSQAVAQFRGSTRIATPTFPQFLRFLHSVLSIFIRNEHQTIHKTNLTSKINFKNKHEIIFAHPTNGQWMKVIHDPEEMWLT